MISKTFKYNDKRILVPVGDDCAVIKTDSSFLVLTTDDMVDGTHFISSFLTPNEIASRFLRMNVSDLYSMGNVKPLYSLTNVSIPRSVSDTWIIKFMKQLKKEMDIFGIKNIGGNLSYSTKLHFTMTLIGEIDGRILKRKGAKEGELLCILGDIGFSSVAVKLMKKKKREKLGFYETKIISLFSKPPLFIDFRKNISKYATSMIDNSDGIYKTSQIISEKNSLKVVLNANYLYQASNNYVKKFFNYDFKNIVSAVFESDDYNCVFTISKKNYEKIKKISFVHQIGYLMKGRGVKILNYENKRIKTFEHF